MHTRGKMRFDVINGISDILRNNFIRDERLPARFAVNLEKRMIA